eukprot:9162121-Pyramimonas_sp.AAC.1
MMDNSRLWHFFGVRKYLGVELNYPVVEWLIDKGLMQAPESTAKKAFDFNSTVDSQSSTVDTSIPFS